MHLTYAPDRIPLAAGTNVAFYTNISIPLVGVLLLGVGSAYLLATLKDEYGRRRMKHYLALVILLPLTFFLLLGSFVEYSRPTPEIAISDDSIVCHRREAKWTDISDIQLVQSRTAALLLDRPSAGERRNVLSCNLGAMTAEPIVVYDAIYAAWQSARSR